MTVPLPLADALLVRSDVLRLLGGRRADTAKWLDEQIAERRIPRRRVAARELFRWGDVVEATLVTEAPAPSRSSKRPRVKL